MSHPAPPDGSDPRVLTPAEDEPTVTIARGRATGESYHTHECAVVKRMATDHEVPLSLAKWKGYDKCGRCRRIGGEDYDRPGGGPRTGASAAQLTMGVDAIACLQLRTRLLRGETQRALADAMGVGCATVGRHARGECSCEHHGRPLAYDGGAYAPADTEGVPKHITGLALMDEQICMTMRQTLVREGVTADHLARVLGVDINTVRYHGGGKCAHENRVPAAVYDDEAETWTTEGDA